MTPEQQAVVQADIDAIESQIQTLGNAFDEHKRLYKEAVGKLTSKRDELATVLKAHRAGLGHLIRPTGIESQAGVATPGS